MRQKQGGSTLFRCFSHKKHTFSAKSCQNICTVQKKAVPLHRLIKNIELASGAGTQACDLFFVAGSEFYF